MAISVQINTNVIKHTIINQLINSFRSNIDVDVDSTAFARCNETIDLRFWKNNRMAKDRHAVEWQAGYFRNVVSLVIIASFSS